MVVKLGTSTLSDGTPHLSQPRMVDLARQMCRLRAQGAEVILVSSGAIAAGREALNFPELPKDMPAKQMLAAVGQPQLMGRWARLFAIYDQPVAQVLLTRADLRSRPRYLNARNTLLALLAQGVIPVVNENDTVATEEIRVGDNDNLSALVSNLVDADLLVLLTDQEGLFAADPRIHPEAQLVARVDTPAIDPDLWAGAGRSGDLGVGGMHTKLQAADLARRSGAAVVIARGSLPDVLVRVAGDEPLGTRFEPTSTAVESRKRYLLSGEGSGRLVVDQGAAHALRRGGSLLPAGLQEVAGNFERGDSVSLYLGGDEIARGLVNYDASACSRLCGLQSHEIEPALGYYYGDEIVHRNNLVLL